MLSQLGRHLKALLAEGFAEDLLRAALGQLRDRPQLGPSTLPSLVNELVQGSRRGGTTGVGAPHVPSHDEWATGSVEVRL